MSGDTASAAILDKVDRQKPESSEAQARHLMRPPGRKSTWERQELLRQVSDLKGRPFTAAFLAAATGVEVSEVTHNTYPSLLQCIKQSIHNIVKQAVNCKLTASALRP